MWPIFRRRRQDYPKSLKFEDIAIEVERTRWIERQVKALHNLYREREKLIAEELLERYPELYKDLEGQEVDPKDIIRRKGGSIYMLSEERKKYLIMLQDEYISKYIARKLKGLDDKRARRMLIQYNTALKLGEDADLDEVLKLQEDLIKIGWTKEDAKRPPVIVVQLPVVVERGGFIVHKED